jgi:hypothetical protein
MNAANCDPRRIDPRDINNAFKYAAGAALAPAVPLAAIEGGGLLTPLALQNPIQTYEFLENALSPEPPQPGTTLAPYAGTLAGYIKDKIVEMLGGK